MTYDVPGADALDYMPCRYGRSRLVFRGPRRSLERPYVALLGGTETYGRFVEAPYPLLLEDHIGMPCINLGVPNAGLDVFLGDAGVLEVARGAALRIVQLPPPENHCNPYYSVHPRRNDRMTAPTEALRTLFGPVELCHVHFTGHLMAHLRRCDRERARTVEEALRAAYSEKLARLAGELGGPTVFLRFGARSGDGPAEASAGLRREDIVEVVPSAQARAEGTGRMVFPDLRAAAAAALPGAKAHEEAAAALAAAVRGFSRV